MPLSMQRELHFGGGQNYSFVCIEPSFKVKPMQLRICSCLAGINEQEQISCVYAYDLSVSVVLVFGLLN